ncbi:hypothetical protein BUE67_15895, partial [Corynebacterium diphtheriae]
MLPVAILPAAGILLAFGNAMHNEQCSIYEERNQIMFKKLFGQLQRIGKALMLPVAILPAAGILLAFGNAMHNEQ